MVLDRAYLDHNATSPLRPEAAAAMAAVAGCGNASSIHEEGRRARAALERGRAQVSALAGASPGDVIFTAGGTEANASVLRPGALLAPDGSPVERLVASATEHASVLSGHGFRADAVEIVGVDGAGRVRLDHLADLLAVDGRPAVVSVQVANSETGVVQPIVEVARVARTHGAAVHADAVQAAGRLPLDMAALGIDALTLSAHKLGGPMGVGALVVASARRGPAAPLIRGGGQENGWRSGTENVPGIVGFGAAAEVAAQDLGEVAARLRGFRDAASAVVRGLAPDAVIFGDGAERLPNTLCFAIPGLKAETALIALDLSGIAVSSGSACSSGKVGRSHVLAAMGAARDVSAGAIRLSFGWPSAARDVERFAEGLETVLRRLYETGRARAA